jgi:multiple sugar transport system permease protein
MLATTGNSQRVFQLVMLTILVLGALLMVGPLLYMVGTSLRGDVFALETPPIFFPESPTLRNFERALASRNFLQAGLNSLFVAVCTSFFVVLLSSMMAYAFARFQFRAKQAIFYTLLAMMMVPTMMLIIPQFIFAKNLGLINTLPSLIVVYVSGGLAGNTFLLRGFFEALPRELEESALIDGANHWVIYSRIILPLSKPALSTVAVFSFLGAWDEYIWALTSVGSNELARTLPIAVANFRGVHTSNWGLIFAGAVIQVVPSILIFLFFQRYFVQGLTQGAVRG